MLVGFHVEGWDHLILRTFLARLVEMAEEEIEADRLDSLGRGCSFVLVMLRRALHRFYGKCAQLVVIATDNDGNLDLMSGGASEDPQHPRHWVHAANGIANVVCRWCQLNDRVEATRPELDWLPKKHGRDWPVLIVVPVEAIEAWLLISQALLEPGQGSLYAEKERRDLQKRRFYGKPEPSRDDVEAKALPLIRAMTHQHLTALREYSKSFAQFAEQIDGCRDAILGNRECW